MFGTGTPPHYVTLVFLTAFATLSLTPNNSAAMLAALILAVSILSLLTVFWAIRLEAGSETAQA